MAKQGRPPDASVGGGFALERLVHANEIGDCTGPIFFIRLARCSFRVISLKPSSPVACLFIRPPQTSFITCNSRGASVAWRSMSRWTTGRSARCWRWFSSARVTASSMSRSRNGFARQWAAPARMARTVIGMSPWLVMEMIGVRLPSARSRACSSRPLNSGSGRRDVNRQGICMPKYTDRPLSGMAGCASTLTGPAFPSERRHL